MISQTIETLLMENKRHFLIPAAQVASVQGTNTLTHALLVLTKMKYSRIPVLDANSKFLGELTMAMVTEQMLGLDKIDLQPLDKITIAQVMDTNVKTVENPYDLEEILHLLVDNAFLPVVSKHQDFVGIITRREMMKSLNYLAHNFDKNDILVDNHRD
ncbi:CBS domain-containing protein [Agrilactobacillus composti DSM 18527 = JCM 14202]|jgi:predicted transcriptional regulator|uniref:CBS domain-containing protein n=1 Tax=Agrilactobacillus composti DSM 18527 = JCM 14202 TaxID=1423734 RepID=X0QML2_9LACO|nr:cyclic-di-AMP-binding protein CbpB [Agrilactobacillus composti]KRM32443.1 CBS domain-containing protein [Agrilactobacillus composti DSM 18527 = JCM 14202]MCH4171824.1 CBS domain-containing protein [Lactobacillus sp.]GAF39865.1 CBS domain protein [Agrilactobacillus composti DSM 18527 = JCM 14202]